MNIWRKLQIKLKNRWNDYNIKKNILLLLFWLSIIGWFIGLKLSAFISDITNDLTGFKYMWILFLMLPIPILSVVLGKKYKKIGYHCKKNIIGGVIMILLYIMSGWSTIFYISQKDKLLDDYTYLTTLEEKINFDFPDDGNILTNKLTTITTSTYQILAISDVTFNNQEEIKELEESINNSEIWTNSNSSYLQIIKPSFFITEYNPNTYYSIYIEDLNTFNTVPNKTGNYKTYYLSYNKENKKLDIYEYNLFFNV